jgi:hypothetical protein
VKRPYAFPLFFAVTSMVGLVVALVGEGWLDGVGAAALTLPFFALGWRLRPEPPRPARNAR